MKEKKINNFLIYVFFLSLVVSGCGGIEEENAIVDINDEYTNGTSSNNENYEINDVRQEEDDVVEVVTEKLIVDGDKCIGCGKCVNTASGYFELEDGKAVIINQENLDMLSVRNAMNKCPVGAISII